MSFLSYVFIRFLKDGLFFVLIKRRKERRKVGRRVSYKTKYEQRTHRKGKTSTRMRGRLNLDWSQIFTQSSSLYLTNWPLWGPFISDFQWNYFHCWLSPNFLVSRTFISFFCLRFWDHTWLSLMLTPGLVLRGHSDKSRGHKWCQESNDSWLCARPESYLCISLASNFISSISFTENRGLFPFLYISSSTWHWSHDSSETPSSLSCSLAEITDPDQHKV